MEIKLTAGSTGKLIYTNTYPVQFESGKLVHRKQLHIKEAEYDMVLDERWFEGVHIGHSKIKVSKPEEFSFQRSEQHISYLFCLDGAVDYQADESESAAIQVYGDEQATLSTSQQGTVIRIGKSAELVYVQLTQDYFKRLTEKTQHTGTVFFGGLIPQALKLLLNNLLHYQYQGNAERIYLEARILELTGYTFQNELKNSGIKDDDVQKILAAKKIVEDNIQKPYSLIELSRKAGINDFKLKKGFKGLTGFTVFGYLFKLRMDKAWGYLQNERKQVNEVSFLVGYKNPQHFISAFKKHFKILPGSLNKS